MRVRLSNIIGINIGMFGVLAVFLVGMAIIELNAVQESGRKLQAELPLLPQSASMRGYLAYAAPSLAVAEHPRRDAPIVPETASADRVHDYFEARFADAKAGRRAAYVAQGTRERAAP